MPYFSISPAAFAFSRRAMMPSANMITPICRDAIDIFCRRYYMLSPGAMLAAAAAADAVFDVFFAMLIRCQSPAIYAYFISLQRRAQARSACR